MPADVADLAPPAALVGPARRAPEPSSTRSAPGGAVPRAGQAGSADATARTADDLVPLWPEAGSLLQERPTVQLPVGDRPVEPWWREPSAGPHLVAFVSGSGGTGVTTTATGAGLALAATGAARLVDVGTGHASSGPRLDTPRRSSLADVVRAGPPEPPAGSPGGLVAIDGTDERSGPPEPDLVRTALGRLSRGPGTTLLDIGNDASRAATTALAEADRAVLVTNLGQAALDAAGATVDRLGRTAPAQARTLVVAVVLGRWQRAARVERHLRARLPEGAGGWVVVPYDRAAARSGPLDPLRLRSRTRAAYERLAGLLTSSRRVA
ncbi:hypothetical protein KZZ52_27825 [Dactylosporangium sp. AC04546]|uniref:MinD/ParA family ATP-binding protein n=1 Tax=Dactylosporangium sp. AC04546 TaxID=2862460 RepID=UPI002E7BE215|nr:hypothetical protein [Dactylosporangium sp. AC04546]WVK89076.1 hypothetical protein KZZ52_27825 [Dactylosporangium sp. AC04546]